MPGELVLQGLSELSDPSRRLESASACHQVGPASDEVCRLDEPIPAHPAPAPRRHGAYERWLPGRDSQRGGGDGQSVEWSFDNIDHALMLRAVRKHVTCKWALLYIERWLRAPMEQDDGTRIERTCGTPQGGVVSPILSNLFMHYAFDLWMTRTHPDLPWCRYADDGLVHCRSEQEAQTLKVELQTRLAECRLELHPTKTKVVYCRDGRRRGKYPNVKFDFLGYCFRPRRVLNHRDNTLFCGFTPAVSVSAMKAMRATIRELGFRRRTELSVADIARQINPLLRGWFAYYGRYAPSALAPVLRYVNLTLRAWVMRKFKRFAAKKFVRVTFSNEWPGNTRICSCTGGWA